MRREKTREEMGKKKRRQKIIREPVCTGTQTLKNFKINVYDDSR